MQYFAARQHHNVLREKGGEREGQGKVELQTDLVGKSGEIRALDESNAGESRELILGSLASY